MSHSPAGHHEGHLANQARPGFKTATILTQDQLVSSHYTGARVCVHACVRACIHVSSTDQ